MTGIDEYAPGHVEALGTYRFTAEEIVAFARKFDPQPFHLDAEAARHSVFGGLCASGWHTAAVWMKLNVAHKVADARRRREAGLPLIEFGPSPGVRNLRWLKPVFAGSTVAFSNHIRGRRPYRGRPGWSIVESSAEARNEDGEPVMTFDSAVLVRFPETDSARSPSTR